MSENQTKLGVAPNVGGLLCNVPCCIGFIFSIVAVIVEKENKFVRFHAFQSLLLHGVAFLFSVAFQIAIIALTMMVGSGLASLLGLLSLVISVGFLAAQILLMVKANGNEEFRLPVIGDMAAKWA
ncbi:MAG: DUF4870 domain-containing protein [Vicinamibacteria bacterium]